MLLFGGIVGEDIGINDTWAFDMSTHAWTILHDGSGAVPAARGGSACFFDGETGEMFIYGGREDEGINYLSDAWSFDPLASEWSLLDDGTGYGPMTRKNFSWGWTSTGRKLTIFGGHTEPPHIVLNDAWALDLETLEWEEIHDGTGTAPCPRHAGGGFYDCERHRLITFGGSDGAGAYFSDTWALVRQPDVALDIRPGACPNPLNVKSNGVLPVALLGQADFDVAMIDPESLLMEGVAPLRSSFEDVAAPNAPEAEPCDCNDDGPDGYTDLTLKFRTQEIVEALGDVFDGETRALTITGVTVDGVAFEGTDCVRILKKGAAFETASGHELTVEMPERKESVSSVSLSSIQPNPFASQSRISFTLPTAAHVRLAIYSASGRRIRTVAAGSYVAGEHTVSWDGRDGTGRRVATGIYFCRLEAEGEVDSDKLVLVK
jgi:hypothetical protein